MDPALEREIRELWALIPPVKCKGHCQASCQQVPLLQVEAAILHERHGYQFKVVRHNQFTGGLTATDFPTLGPNFTPCEFLTQEGRCGVYEDRPYICRSYGHHVDYLYCGYGCSIKTPLRVEIMVHVMRKLMAMCTRLQVNTPDPSPDQVYVKLMKERVEAMLKS